MKRSFRPNHQKRAGSLLLVLASLVLSFSLHAKECVDVAKYIDDVLSKKELRLAEYDKFYKANSGLYMAHEQRYAKAGYQSLGASERGNLISKLVSEAGGEKAVFDLRLNSKADELIPMLKANHTAQIVDPKIVDGKLVAKLNGSSTELSHTIEIPLDAIDNFSFWKGAARTGDRQVFSFSDKSGKALEDFMKSVGNGKSTEEYTKAFQALKSDVNFQNDILAALERKAASGAQLSKDEFALAMMVERNRTSTPPARLKQLLDAYEGRVGALKGAAPDAESLLKDIPMDPSMRARAERLLSSVEGQRLPPAVIKDTPTDVAVRATHPGERAPIREFQSEGQRVITDQSPRQLTPERVKVDAAMDGRRVEAEILHDSDPGMRPGFKDIPRQSDEVAQAAAGADDIADTRTALAKPDVAQVALKSSDEGAQVGASVDFVVDSNGVARRAEDVVDGVSDASKVDFVVDSNGVARRAEEVVDGASDVSKADFVVDSNGVARRAEDVVDGASDASKADFIVDSNGVVRHADDVAETSAEGLTLTSRISKAAGNLWEGAKGFFRRVRQNPTPVVHTATTAGRVAHAALPLEPNRDTASATDPATPPEQPGNPEEGETDPGTPQTPALPPAAAQEAIADINFEITLVEETRLKPVWKAKIAASAKDDKDATKEVLEKGHINVTCQMAKGVEKECNFDGAVGTKTAERDYKRLLDEGYRVFAYWVYKASDGTDVKKSASLTIPVLDCENIPEEDTETARACEMEDEGYVPSYHNITGPQLQPMPQMPQLRPRGAFITPGFN